MNPAQLSALFAQHKTAVLGAAAAAVAGLALLHRKKAGGDTAAAVQSATIPAAAVVPGGGSYDSSAYDVYSAIQSELGPLLDQARKANSITTAPAPATSPLLGYKPGLYRRSGTTQIFQLTNDGKLDYLTLDEHKKLIQAGQKVTDVSKDNNFWKRTYLDPAGTFKNWTTALKPPGRTT